MSATRAITYPKGYTAYFGPNDICVYTTTEDNNEASKKGSFSYINGIWNSSVVVTDTKKYYLYGYMPVSNDFECIVSTLTGENYSAGAKLRFSNLPPVMSGDFSVVTGVLQVTSSNPENATGKLEPGSFRYLGKPIGENFVCLMLDHLYSCVRFQFKVNATYNNLRTIKLKKVELKSVNQVSYPLEVIMKSEDSYEVTWDTAVSRSNDFVSLFTSDNGETLLSEVSDEIKVDGYFVPNSSIASNLELRCTYDVYDKEENLVRQNSVAVNKLPASLTAVANKRTNLTLTVNPTYLYVLSDPDLDNPTFVLSGE